MQASNECRASSAVTRRPAGSSEFVVVRIQARPGTGKLGFQKQERQFWEGDVEFGLSLARPRKWRETS